MKKKVLMTALAVVLSLSALSTAAMTVTTAFGNGADGGIRNDGGSGGLPTYIGGASTAADLRRYDTVRARAVILRFDLRNVGGDISNPTLTITTTGSPGNRARTLNVWALTDDSLDNWSESTISYNTAPGVVHEGETGYALNYITIDAGKMKVIGTVPVAAAPAVNTGSLDPNFIAGNKNGLLTLLLFTSISDSSQSWYVAMKENGTGIPTLTFPNARCATNPVPAAGASVLPSQSTLSWTQTEPNHPSGTITCDVYLGTTEPNLAKPGYNLTKIASGVAANSVAIPAGMQPLSEGKYYWIVNSFDSSTVPPALGTGAVWSFDVTGVPLIIDHPQPQTVVPGQTASFSVSVESFSPADYTWYRSSDNANNTPADDVQVGTNAETLSFTAAGTHEGYYFCKIVNNSGQANAAYSNTALLIVHRQVAYWTLDAADFTGGLYTDLSGDNHPADPNGPAPAFAAGVKAGSEGVSINAEGFASAGTWNPSHLTNAFTVVMWYKWNGTNGAFQHLISKMDSWAAADMLWELGISAGGSVNMLRSGGGNFTNGSPVAGAWEFIAVTYNGTTATIYRAVDGNVNFTTASAAFTLGTDAESTLWLGARGNYAEPFNGAIDDVQIFNYAKDAKAIADLYNEMLTRDFCLMPYGSTEFDLDINNNCRIDLADFAALSANWMGCGLYPQTACP